MILTIENLIVNGENHESAQNRYTCALGQGKHTYQGKYVQEVYEGLKNIRPRLFWPTGQTRSTMVR